MKFGSLFTGGGLADLGLQSAGFIGQWGIELNPKIAPVAEAALGHPVKCQSVTETNWRSLPPIDLLWASPPCPNFSVAKSGRGETPEDLDLASAVAAAIQSLEPAHIAIENVGLYAKSQSAAIILATIKQMGYYVTAEVFDAADYGVPQNRRRWICRASKNLIRPMPTQKHMGWYTTIAHRIEELPLAQGRGQRHTPQVLPSPPFVIENTGSRGDKAPTIRLPHQPFWTIRASCVRSRNHRVVFPDKVLALDLRAMAALQTMPDNYPLPPSSPLAGRIIGNGVPCRFARAIAESFCP